jgi:hypothetical protein
MCGVPLLEADRFLDQLRREAEERDDTRQVVELVDAVGRRDGKAVVSLWGHKGFRPRSLCINFSVF